MKIGSDHLAYSTLVHPGDNWDEIWTSVRTYLPPVKARLSPNEPFGVSLRLAAATVQTLLADPAKIAELRRFFDDNDMYVYTANAFPYGSFKGQRVKEQVYEPDWRSDERVEYTIGVGEILAQLAPEGIAPSIQSPPLGFKPRVTDSAIVDSYAEHVLKVAAALIEIEARTGRTVTLALEPEPMCFLETTAETIDFFTTRLFTGAGAERLGELSGLAVSDAHGALRRHIGIVFDPCHQAVEYEDVSEMLMALRDAGVPVFKLQQAAALFVPEVTKEAVDRLRRYVETVYLTQTYQRRGGEIQRFLNLDDAIAAYDADPSGEREWRIHFHVPVFLDDLGEFRTTRFAIEESLAFHAEHPVSRHLEIETYTWDVLPDELKTGDIVEYVSRELEWVRDEIASLEAKAV